MLVFPVPGGDTEVTPQGAGVVYGLLHLVANAAAGGFREWFKGVAALIC